MTTHKGQCFCGTVEVEVQGEPEAMLALTERELPAAAGGQENTGLSLRLVWYPPFSPREGGSW